MSDCKLKFKDIPNHDELGDVLFELIENGNYGISGCPYSDEALCHIFWDMARYHVEETIDVRTILSRYREDYLKNILRNCGYNDEKELMKDADIIHLSNGLVLVIGV